MTFFSLLKGLFEVNPLRRMRIDPYLEVAKKLLDSDPFLKVEINKTMKIVFMNTRVSQEVRLPPSNSYCELFGLESDCSICTLREEVLVC